MDLLLSRDSRSTKELRRTSQQAQIRKCRLKAEELRALADTMTTADNRRGLSNAAAHYDRVADELEEAEDQTSAV